MPEKQRPTVSKYNLITGQDSYASQTAQNPETARLLIGFVPGDDGALYREAPQPQFVNIGAMPVAEVKKLFEFDFVSNSTITRFYFAVVATSPGATTFQLWQTNGVAAWAQVGAVGTLQNIPAVAKVQSSNLLHLSDGVKNFLFDGTNWIVDGFSIPLNQPAIDVFGAWHFGTNVFDTSNTSITTFISDSNGNIQICTTAGMTGARAPVWATTPGSTTTDNTAVWTCYGAVQSWSPLSVYVAHSIVYNSHGDFVYTTGGGTSGATEPNWDGRKGGTNADGSVGWVNLQKFVPLENGNGAYINHEWRAAQVYSTQMIVVDINGNVQVCSTSGTSGNTMPAWATTPNTNTNDNSVVWKCLGPYVALLGWQPNTAYSALSVIVDTEGKFKVASTGGISGTTQPSWFKPQAVYNDNTVTWVAPLSDQAVGGFPPSSFVGKYYWFTMADETPGRIHESTSSAISLGTGPLNHQVVAVRQIAGSFNIALGSQNATVGPTNYTPGPNIPKFDSSMVGRDLYIDGGFMGVIGAFSGDGTQIHILTPASNNFAGDAQIVDDRTTQLHIYSSESDGSKIGQLSSATIPVTPSNSHQVAGKIVFYDMTPFVGQTGTNLLSIFRPVRNDPPPTSLLAEVHKYRIFRRRESRPNFFNFTANEEVSSGINGDPTECVPGADPNTLSDIVNEQVYPDSSNFIRALCSHGDALYIGTEKQCLPLYGQSIDDFGLSQVTAFSIGVAGQDSMISTAHGLAIVSYDKKVFIYPTSNYYWAYVPNDVNVTDNMVEVGKPLRKVLEGIASGALAETKLKFYFYGRRNWLVLNFKSNTGAYQTWVYDFTNKGWFQLNLGPNVSSIDVWEISTGNKVLVGGSTTGNVFVLDDLTGTFTPIGNMQQATWRPALMDFGNPDAFHIPLNLEFEVSNPAMVNDLTINYWLDPSDVDNPGTPRQVIFKQVLNNSNLYRGYFQGGNVCKRLLVEFNMAQSAYSTNFGAFRGVKLEADEVSGGLG